VRLTDDSIRRRKRPIKGQDFDWDELVSGFGVRYTPTRTSFVVQWRTPDGKKPRESLKPHWPQLTVAAARDQARKRLSQVVGNREAAASQELRTALRTWFERKTELAVWRPRYRTKVDAHIKHFVEGEETTRIKITPTVRTAIESLGHKPVGQVSRTDILRVADGIKRGAAEQFMAVISSFYNDMFERGIEVPNPARNRLKVTGGRRVRTRSLSDAEVLKLWQALNLESDPALGAFELLLFTGARRREVTQMRWAEVNLEAAAWTLPAERRKTGKKDPEPFVINLHPYAVAALNRQPVLEGSPYVFWGRRDKKPFDFHYALIKRLSTLGIPDWRLHDLRRYMRTGLARLAVSQVVAEMCLGHIAKGGLVGVYDRHAYLEEKKAAWQMWGEYLSKIIGACS
jgi:integrase